jgi:hypothetical protein
LRVREADSNPSVIASELVFPNATLSVAGSAVTVQGLVVDGDKGDITVSASGATWTIDNSVVTTAKLGGDITTAGKALLDDADAAAQRTTLGLGTLATQSGTFSGTSSGTNTGDQTNISGNAATVTTNANLTGHVTSVGNAAVLGTFTKSQLDAAVSDGNVLYVGDVTSNATHTGDVTGDTALTIANSAVTLAKMANLAQDQFIGRTTASTGVPETATITAAARTVLDDATVADMVNTLGGATSTGTGGLVRATSPAITTPTFNGLSSFVSADNNTTPFATFYANNLTQGVAVGYGFVGVAGSNATIDFSMLAKGTGNCWVGGSTMNTGIRMRLLDTDNTIWFGSNSAAITANSGQNIFVGQTSSAIGITVNTTTGNLTASGTISSTANGAASTPALSLSGNPFAGTGTTSVPLLYLNQSGATAPTSLNTVGTFIGINARYLGSIHDAIWVGYDGSLRFRVDCNGAVTCQAVSASADINCTSGARFTYSSRGSLSFVSDGVARMEGWGVSTFRLQLSGATSSFPAIKRNGTAVNIRLADDSADAPLTCGNLTASGTLQVGGGTAVANILSATATLDFGSIGSNATETLTITVTGAVAGDSVFLGCPAGLDAGLVFCASVTAADTVTVRMHNSTGGAVDPASATFRATVIRF